MRGQRLLDYGPAIDVAFGTVALLHASAYACIATTAFLEVNSKVYLRVTKNGEGLDGQQCTVYKMTRCITMLVFK